jgi:DNA (cytosine-5)-methyltransferase 1
MLRKIGYSNIQYKVLRARDFGLPQNRERIYIVGFLDKNITFN